MQCQNSYISVARRASARLAIAAVLTTSVVADGCSAFNRKGEGAAIGAGTGAAAGAIIGNQTGSTARGALIGAIIGGAAGAVIGNQMDQQAKELRQEIPGATIQRVAEGIQVTFLSGLLYDTGSDQVRPESQSNLRSLASSLGKFPNTDVLIVGHTDAVGTTADNQALSQRRAASASDYLASQGVSAGRLRTAGRGEMEPVATNATDAGRQANRRVEVVIVANAAARKSGN